MVGSRGQVKFGVAYPLPAGFQVSAAFQNLPGVDRNSNYVVRNAEVAESLGRNLGSCRGQAVCTATATVTNALFPVYTEFEDRLNQLDLRLAKAIGVGKTRVKAMADVYNIFNSTAISALAITYNPTNTYLRPTTLQGGRLFRFGVDLQF